MNSKTILLVAGLCGGLCSGPLLGQGGAGGGAGAGGAGASAGAANAGSAASAGAGANGATTTAGAAGSSASAQGSRKGATPGTPDMSPTMPSRSVLSTEGPPDTSGKATDDPGRLPAGLSVTPAAPGVSPISGLPVSEIPAVSQGTRPLGPNSTPPAVERDSGISRQSRPPAAPTITDPTAIAAHPQTNPRIGMGETVVVPMPPPAPQVEVSPQASTNDLGQVWIAGHYSWVGGQWSWVEGTWQRPPHERATWIPGTYDAQNKRWTEGHWDTTRVPSRRERERTQDER
jgi:hypothetical protein